MPNESSNLSILFARQPIYDRRLQIQAYELLFRDDSQNNTAPDQFDGTAATREVLLNAFTESDIENICAGKFAFVNFNREMLIQGLPFSPDKLVIEILEDVLWDEEIATALRARKSEGFKIALDDFAAKDTNHPLLPFADIIKLEYPAYTPESLRCIVAKLKSFGVEVLAEKIETQADFRLALEADCSLFQGYFLSRPEIVHGRKMPASKMAVLQLITQLQSSDLDIQKINAIISKDPFLSVRLLRLVNSASYRRNTEIHSIHMAIMALGIDRIRDWACMIALGKLEDKPHALQLTALARARFCALIATKISPADEDNYFTTGLFSCLDAFFDQPLKDILNLIPLHQCVSDALIQRKGKAGLALHTALMLEQGKLSCLRTDLLKQLKIDIATLNDVYLDSIQWAQDNA